MLIYNSKKEFIGIDEQDLNALGFSNLSELRAEAEDFADMFVKTPGYVHNFKHVNWIDFLTCADSTESPKVIIHANSKSFKCTLDVKVAYLTDEPSSKAYLVHLNNIKTLTESENENISDDIVNKPTPTPIAIPTQSIEESSIEEITEEPILEQIDEIEAPKENYQEQIETTAPDLDLPLDLDFHDEIQEINEADVAIDLPDDEIKLDIHEEESLEDALKLDFEEDLPETELQTKEVEYTEEVVFDNGYVYNPQIASDELGLPVDLIEEFIEDFVAQAKEFKDELYESLNTGNNDNVKILSHKLKGVAANLRIEDAFEVLTIINTSSDANEIKTNLDTLYKIISKLSGEKIVVTKNKIIEDVNEVEKLEELEQDDEIEIDFKSDEPFLEEEPTDDAASFENDEIELDFKVDEPVLEQEEVDSEEQIVENVIEDNEVPAKIDIPELVDDEFLNQDDEKKVEIDDAIDMETITDEETLSLENESVEIDDIELLEGYNMEDGETLDIENLDIEPAPIQYNKNHIANEIGIPYESFIELFDDYASDAQEISDSINGAIEANDSKTWQNKAVKLKGMSDNMRIHEFTKELETLMTTQDTIVARDASETIAKSITQISKLKG